nr:glutaredoxin family protein [uncultured Undibacterium sp.]
MQFTVKQSTAAKPNRLQLMLGIFALVSLASLTSLAQAQTYKWIGPNGKMVYSDTPPPANAKKLISKSMDGTAQQSNVKFPPDLEVAVRKNPVTFYTTIASTPCGPCNEARSMLKQNGIPFAEKTVSTKEDVDKFRQLSGDNQLPLLQISKAKFSGFDSVEWRTALSTAGYPETSILPKDYRYPAPEPAAPPAPTENKEKTDNTSEQVKPRTASPTGIRF